MNVTSFGQSVFAYAVKDLKMRSFWIIQVGLVTSVLIRDTQRDREDGLVTTEAETGVMQSQTQGCWSPQKQEEVERTLPGALWSEYGPTIP